MTDRLIVRLWNAQQGHAALMQAWMLAKAHLMAGTRLVLEIKPETRSSEQNRKMWACLTDIARQVDWHGLKLDAEDWKHILSASLTKQRVAPGIDGGFVVLGNRTSKMTKAEMSEMIELCHAFGAQHDVVFSDEAIDPLTGEITTREVPA